MFNIGDKITVVFKPTDGRSSEEKRTLRGTITYVNNSFVTIKTSKYSTSIALVDFTTGHAVLKSLKPGAKSA